MLIAVVLLVVAEIVFLQPLPGRCKLRNGLRRLFGDIGKDKTLFFSVGRTPKEFGEIQRMRIVDTDNIKLSKLRIFNRQSMMNCGSNSAY